MGSEEVLAYAYENPVFCIIKESVTTVLELCSSFSKATRAVVHKVQWYHVQRAENSPSVLRWTCSPYNYIWVPLKTFRYNA